MNTLISVCKIFGHSFGEFVKPDGSPLPRSGIFIPENKKIRVYKKCSRCDELYDMHFWGDPYGDEMEW
jgi:hypothetical protein